MPGFVYIMSNKSFIQGRVKIGKSDRDPESYRKFELETTGVPEPFFVEYWAFVEDHHGLERTLHQIFSAERVNPNREFFDTSIPSIILMIREKGRVLHEKINYRSPQDILNEETRREKEIAIEAERKLQEKLVLEKKIISETKVKSDAERRRAATARVDRLIDDACTIYSKSKVKNHYFLKFLLFCGTLFIMESVGIVYGFYCLIIVTAYVCWSMLTKSDRLVMRYNEAKSFFSKESIDKAVNLELENKDPGQLIKRVMMGDLPLSIKK